MSRFFGKKFLLKPLTTPGPGLYTAFNMILTGIFSGLVTVFGLLLAGAIVYRLAKRKIRAFVVDFVTSPSPQTPSPFAALVSLIAVTFGSEIAGSLKAVFMGVQSVDAKNERSALAASVISGNSMLGAIVSGFPAVGKAMKKNPGMAALADLVLGRVLSGKGQSTGGPTSPASPASKFDRF